VSDHIVPHAKSRLSQLLDVGRKQLSPEEYTRLENIVSEIRRFGMAALTASMNYDLMQIMVKINYEMEISESPEYSEALIECDRTFLGSELRQMFLNMGLTPPRKAKKEMCAILYMMGAPRVVEVMGPLMGKEEEMEEVSGEL
jgi:hypothetical protein